MCWYWDAVITTIVHKKGSKAQAMDRFGRGLAVLSS
jgi:hypothetical protein